MHEQIKYFEVRDSGTCIPVMAIRIVPGVRDHLMLHAGFAVAVPYVLLLRFHPQEMRYDPFDWKCDTMASAHQFIERDFDELENLAVVDVQYLRGETPSPKPTDFPLCRPMPRLDRRD